MRVILWTSYYRDKNPERMAELEYCMAKNIMNDKIDIIVVLLEGRKEDFAILQHKKVQVLSCDRPTYKLFFEAINHNVKDDDISVIANTDIYFDETIDFVRKYMAPNKCFALSRWHLFSATRIELHNEKWSQDTWIFKGKVRKITFCDFYMGIPGCDNRIAYEIAKAGYEITNPAYSIKTIHYHKSDVRNYSQNYRIQMPFLPVPVCSL